MAVALCLDSFMLGASFAAKWPLPHADVAVFAEEKVSGLVAHIQVSDGSAVFPEVPKRPTIRDSFVKF